MSMRTMRCCFNVTDDIQEPLTWFVDHVLTSTLTTRVILRRSTTRLGLMNARIYGVQFATAQTLTFLDSHCECVPGQCASHTL